MAFPTSHLPVGPMRRWRDEHPEAATLGELHKLDPDLYRDIHAWYAEIAADLREKGNAANDKILR